MDRAERDVDRYRKRPIGKEFHGFMHLPLAIHYMTYEVLLVRGQIFVRPTVSGHTEVTKGKPRSAQSASLMP